MKNKRVKVTDYTRKGKKTTYMYMHLTGWQVFMLKVKKFFKRLFWTIVILGIIAGVFELGRYLYPAKVYTTQEIIKEVDNLSGKIEELKNSLVLDIQKCESKGYKETDGIIVFDSNNQASIGTFQYQRKTVMYYNKTLYNKVITPKEAILISLDDQKAKELTTDIIFKDSKGWRNWYNCGVKVGAEGRLATINQLQK